MLLSQVNQRVGDLIGERFYGEWLLIVHWDHVHPSPHGEDDHRGIPEDDLEKVS